MSEELLKVELSPARGQLFGTFTEGQPVAEAIGAVVAFQVDGKEGERTRRYGRVSAVHDDLLNIDNKRGSSEQVVATTIFFFDAPELVLKWRQIAVAVAEVAMQTSGDDD
jgi:hypothetical protein